MRVATQIPLVRGSKSIIVTRRSRAVKNSHPSGIETLALRLRRAKAWGYRMGPRNVTLILGCGRCTRHLIGLVKIITGGVGAFWVITGIVAQFIVQAKPF